MKTHTKMYTVSAFIFFFPPSALKMKERERKGLGKGGDDDDEKKKII
jgi:hypothetical protein